MFVSKNRHLPAVFVDVTIDRATSSQNISVCQ